MTMESITQPTPLAEVDVAVIGAGPVGLMMANLLGLSGLEVAILEGSGGLRGIPRAIAYDAETLRSFSMIGLFDEIAPELVQSPHVRHVNARGRTLMEMDFPLVGLTVIPLWASSISRSSRESCFMDYRGSPTSGRCSNTW